MTSLTNKLSELVGAAFEAVELPRELGVVRVSDRPDLCQFQCNGAMAAAKIAKKNPRDIAQAVIDHFSQCHSEHGKAVEESHKEEGDSSSQAPRNDSVLFSKIEIAGPGFINLNVTDEFLSDYLTALKDDARFGVSLSEESETIIIDYAQPNVAKPMHVGHLRSSIIGEAVKRIYKFAGYNTIGDIHLGDWGTHMGMVVSEYIKTGQQDFVLNTNLDDEGSVQALMDDLTELYPRVSGECKENQERLEEAKAATVKLQNKDPDYYNLWQVIRDVSVQAQKKNFEALDVHFDIWWGESTAHDTIAPMVEDLQKKKFAVESDGAWVVPVKRDDDNKEVPPLILYKRDGGVMYGTTDLATLVDRMDQFKPSKIVYVVDQRQHLHFEQVFRAARLTGIVPEEVELTHAGFGTMNGKDGKPFKTRAGGVMRLEDLISTGLEKARARLKEANLADDMGEDEREEVAHKVAIAAIKFADLQNQRQSDYVFDLDRLTSFEGKTGPYLLYQTVRIKSLLKKARAQDIDFKNADLTIQEEDRALALLLGEFPSSLALAMQNYAPHHLCDYVYKLAQAFSSFYGNCHILSEENEALRASRLLLCQRTADQLEQGLELLGIRVPERM